MMCDYRSENFYGCLEGIRYIHFDSVKGSSYNNLLPCKVERTCIKNSHVNCVLWLEQFEQISSLRNLS